MSEAYVMTQGLSQMLLFIVEKNLDQVAKE